MDKNQDKNHEEYIKKGKLLINHLEEMQYSYFNGRPEWITLQNNDLKLYLAFIHYGHPIPRNTIFEKSYEDAHNSEEIFNLYQKEIKQKALDMYEILKKRYFNLGIFTLNIEVGNTMIHSICKKECDICHNFPKKDIHSLMLIRLKLKDGKLIFIDFVNSRIYCGWDEYLEDNNLPEGYMFYPKSGLYDASKSLYQNITPASKKLEKVFKAADMASHISMWTGGILVIGSSLMFPLAVPINFGITLAMSALSAVTSSFQMFRGTQKIVDMFKHDVYTSGSEACKKWADLAIAAIGFITAPIYAITAIKELNSTVQSSSKAITIFKKSACFTQCTLVVIRATLGFIDSNFEITLENVLKLRLDVFITTGALMLSSNIRHILGVMVTQAVWASIFKTMEQIPYCLSKSVWKSVYFLKNHFTEFVNQVMIFFAKNLTVENLLFAWKTIRHVFDDYQKQTAQLDVGNLLRHVVDDMDLNERVKYVLRGERMVKLLDSLRDYAPKKSIRLTLVKYCVDHVLREAKKLSANHDECVAMLAGLGETRREIVDDEFCKCYGLEGCAMDQYLLWAIGEVNAVTLMAEYEEYASRPENMFDDEMIVNRDNGDGYSTKAYTFVAPCSVLDLKICLQFAKLINPQPHQYADYRIVDPEPSVSLIFGVSANSINIVFFGIDLINGVPKMKICFFEKKYDFMDSSISTNDSFSKLLMA